MQSLAACCPFSLFFLMKRCVILSFSLLCILFSPRCVGQNARRTAKTMNAEIDGLLQELSAVKQDTAAYYKGVVQLMKDAVICDYFDSKPDKKERAVPAIA